MSTRESFDASRTRAAPLPAAKKNFGQGKVCQKGWGCAPRPSLPMRPSSAAYTVLPMTTPWELGPFGRGAPGIETIRLSTSGFLRPIPQRCVNVSDKRVDLTTFSARISLLAS